MPKISEILEKARAYETKYMVDDQTKPVFHVTAPVGWANDPNGFSTFENRYHFFYQYHPYSTHWGLVHWGHYVSDDMVRWTLLPCALAPDTAADKDGCFSGTAIEHEGKHILMYTGIVNGRQQQCIAVGDGLNYEKISENPVIDRNSEDFRDPKIWHDGDSYRALIVYRGEDGSGELLEYKSKDLKHWEFVNLVDRSENLLGQMWECPDAFCLGNKRFILLSIQGMEGQSKEFHPGNICLYWMCGKDNQRLGPARVIDYGLDFYAPQTLETPDGRRIMIAWAQTWENYLTPHDFRYSGIMTFPRELSLLGDELRQTPIRELDNYLKESDCPETGRVFDLRVEADTKDWFSVKVASNGKLFTEIKYDYLRGTLLVDRSYSGSRQDVLHTRTLDIRNRGGKIDLRIIMDRYIMEIFVNDGEQVLTCLVYTPLDCDKIVYDGNDFSYNAKKFDICIDS